MKKYTPAGNPEQYYLSMIAIELQEANRLKRIEITFQYESGYGSNHLNDYDSKELETLLNGKK